MSNKDIGRRSEKDTVEYGWQFTGVAKSPYDTRPHLPELTAQFKFIATRNGVEIDTSRFMSPNFIALTRDELSEGLKARIHGIPAAVIKNGEEQLGTALYEAWLEASTNKTTATIIQIRPLQEAARASVPVQQRKLGVL